MIPPDAAPQIGNGKTRRQFLKLAGYGTMGVMAGGFWTGKRLFAAGGDLQEAFIPDLDIALSAEPGEMALFPGRPTSIGSGRQPCRPVSHSPACSRKRGRGGQ